MKIPYSYEDDEKKQDVESPYVRNGIWQTSANRKNIDKEKQNQYIHEAMEKSGWSSTTEKAAEGLAMASKATEQVVEKGVEQVAEKTVTTTVDVATNANPYVKAATSAVKILKAGKDYVVKTIQNEKPKKEEEQKGNGGVLILAIGIILLLFMVSVIVPIIPFLFIGAMEIEEVTVTEDNEDNTNEEDICYIRDEHIWSENEECKQCKDLEDSECSICKGSGYVYYCTYPKCMQSYDESAMNWELQSDYIELCRIRSVKLSSTQNTED